eukprot:18739-Heterococcus_DN1.PRE.2
MQNGRLKVVPVPSTGQSAGLTGRIGTTTSNTAGTSDGGSGPSNSTVSSTLSPTVSPTVSSTVSSTAVPVTGVSLSKAGAASAAIGNVLPPVVAAAVTSQSKLQDVSEDNSNATTTTNYKSFAMKSLGSTDEAASADDLAFRATPGDSQASTSQTAQQQMHQAAYSSSLEGGHSSVGWNGSKNTYNKDSYNNNSNKNSQNNNISGGSYAFGKTGSNGNGYESGRTGAVNTDCTSAAHGNNGWSSTSMGSYTEPESTQHEARHTLKGDTTGKTNDVLGEVLTVQHSNLQWYLVAT